jgi:sRNA-binding protein
MSNSATKVETAIAELVVAFPAAFTLDPTQVRPVKLGIRNDIYGQSAISRREPVGTVTATEVRHATERLAVLAKVAAKRPGEVASASRGVKTLRGAGTGKPSSRAATAAPKASGISKRTLPAEPATPGQKRLSLGIKRAAAARKPIR